MRQTTAGKSWFWETFGALVLCVVGFASAVSLLLEKDCHSLETPGFSRYSGVEDALRYWCLHLGLWFPVSFYAFIGLMGLAGLVLVWRERRRPSP